MMDAIMVRDLMMMSSQCA